MSNALAIAAVTRVLVDLLNNGLIDHDVSGAVGGNVTVSALPPDRVLGGNGAPPPTQLNLFLHQVTPNNGWQHADLPTRDGRGNLVQNPLLALDLRYLLTAYAAAELHGEILLGYAMQLLHETPILRRDAIRTALTAPAVDGSILPPAFQALTAADLADQVELIKVTPEAYSLDDMSKLWTALQTHYRITAAYRVSVVLIESRRPARAPLPVLTRGPAIPGTGRDRGVVVQADLLPPFPTVEAITPPSNQVAARMGETLTLAGHHLDGDQVFVRFREPRSQRTLELAPAGAGAGAITVQLPPDPPAAPVPPGSPLDPASWQAGVYSAGLRIQRAGEPDRFSNELPVVLAPRIDGIAPVLAAGIVTFTVTVSPPVLAGQSATLLVGERELPAAALAGAQSATLSFSAGGFVSGTSHWVRLKIDGIESLLIDRLAAPPRFDPTQRVTIP